MKTHTKIVLATLFITVALFGGYLVHASAHDTEFWRSSNSATKTSTGQATSLPTVVADMNQAMAGYGNLSAAATLIDLNNGEEYNAGATTTIYKAASTAKVLTAIDYLHEVETGQDSLSQNIAGYGTAQQLLQEMIEVSDNTAWNDLEDVLGNQEQSYANNLGLHSFTANGYNTMTAADEAKLLALLAEGKLLNTSDRALLYDYMAHTDSTALIPAALPSNATVYNKYGELWGYLNDAAIVQYQGHNFVLVVFTNNPDGTTDDASDQVSLIHAVTTAAFQDITQARQ